MRWNKVAAKYSSLVSTGNDRFCRARAYKRNMVKRSNGRREKKYIRIF